MKKITRMDVEALKREMLVLDEMTQRSACGGTQEISLLKQVVTFLVNNRKVIIIYFVLFLCNWMGSSLCAQKVEDNYNLQFIHGKSDDFKWLSVGSSLLDVDSTELINGKHPLWFRQKPSVHKIMNKPELAVCLYQDFPISTGVEDSIQIILHSKAKNVERFMMKSICIDNQENVISQDSIFIRHENWDADTLKISLKNTSSLIVGLFAFGYKIMWEWDKANGCLVESESQELWLDKIELKTPESNSFTDFGSEYTAQYLNDSCIIPLDTANLYNNIPIPKDKKIIALGETVHGSSSIGEFKYELIKKLITENNCRLVILESPIECTPLWNLLIDERLPEEDALRMIKEVQEINGGTLGETFDDLLIWLRRFNRSAGNKKVYISACNGSTGDIWGSILYSYLREYIAVFQRLPNSNTSLSQEILSALLDCLRSNMEPNDAQAFIVKSKKQLKEVLGETDYKIFSYIISLAVEESKKRTLEQTTRRFLSRDHSMFLSSKWFIDNCLASDNMAAIVAHLGHTNTKNSRFNFPYIHTMGYYFKKYYGDTYFNIGFTTGTGDIISIADYTVAHLKYPIEGSLEKLCIEKEFPYFYYDNCEHTPFKFLYRHIGAKYSTPEIYIRKNLTSCTDAFVFIRESIISAELRAAIPQRMSKMLKRISNHNNNARNEK